jgi:hypothetical protein
VRWALVGGFAVSLRVEPRLTRDVDLAIAVDDDEEAERIVRELLPAGFLHTGAHLEHAATGRLATVRLTLGDELQGGVPVDLLFASSGIEPEVVQASQPLRAFPELVIPVARIGHLLALKLLAARDQDRVDARNLAGAASQEELELARTGIELISRRGCDRGLDLYAALAEVLRPPERSLP